MSYAIIEAALSTLIQGLSDYDSDNVKQGDWRWMGAGKTKGVTLTPGGFSQVDGTLRDMALVTWTIRVELYVAWDGEQNTTVATLKTDRQSIIDRVNQYHKLDGTSGVMNAIIRSAEPIEEFYGNTNFWRQVLSCEVLETATFTRQE